METIDANGNIILTQGDSLEITIEGIPTDQNYKVFFAAQNKDREPVGSEVAVDSLSQSFVVIKLVGNYTRLFTVEEGAKSQQYYYGIKLCSETDNTEETLIIGNTKKGDLNTITVYPQKVEGI